MAGTKTGGSGPPGFPSLTTIKSTAELRKIGVNVFGMASRKESLILQLKVRGRWGQGKGAGGGCSSRLAGLNACGAGLTTHCTSCAALLSLPDTSVHLFAHQ